MKFYEDQQYIKMCCKAYELQEEKYKKGFHEGDYVFDGNKAHLLGCDFLSVAKYFHECPNSYEFRFAVWEDAKISYKQREPYDSVVETHLEKYTLKRIGSIVGIWILCQTDSIELINYPYGFMGLIHELSCLIKEEGRLGNYLRSAKSFEQLLLMFLMRSKYMRYWINNRWISNESWIQLEKEEERI